MRDLRQIKSEVEGVIEYSQDYPFHVNASDIITKWYAAKKPYMERWGGETRMRSTNRVYITLDIDAQNKLFRRMLVDFDMEGALENEASDGYVFGNFLKDNGSGFFDNTVVVDHPSLKIHKGMKILKCFKYFFKSFGDTRWAQDLASRYIQGTKISGYLWLSVDPLDYLTVSENTHNWCSCHALDGEFRAGNINYMIDDTTLVAYLADDDDKNTQLKSFPRGLLWNNKRWRMLIHTNNFKSVIYYNRQYPFNNEALVNNICDMIDTLDGADDFYSPSARGTKRIVLGDTQGEDLSSVVDLEFNYLLGERDCLYDMRDVVDDSECQGYCDLIYSPHYTPVVSWKRHGHYARIQYGATKKDLDTAFHDTFDITIGRQFKCLKCGEDDIERPDTFLCDDCIALEDADEDLFVTCAYCGRRIYEEDKAFNIGDDLVCETCFNATLSAEESATVDTNEPVIVRPGDVVNFEL